MLAVVLQKKSFGCQGPKSSASECMHAQRLSGYEQSMPCSSTQTIRDRWRSGGLGSCSGGSRRLLRRVTAMMSVEQQLYPGQVVYAHFGPYQKLVGGQLTPSRQTLPATTLFIGVDKKRQKKKKKRQNSENSVTLQEIARLRPCVVTRLVAGWLVEVVPCTTGDEYMANNTRSVSIEPSDLNGLEKPSKLLVGQLKVIDSKRLVVDGGNVTP